MLHVPELTNNLFSVHAATSKGNTVLFGHTDCCIKNKCGKVIATGSPSGKLYLLDCETHQMPTEKATVAGRSGSSTSKIDLWHQRLGHINGQQLLQQAKSLEGVDLGSQSCLSFCKACVQGKCHRKSHHSTKKGKSKEKLQLIHMDLSGPMQTQSLGGSRYFITFTDDYSCYCRTYFLKRKSEVLCCDIRLRN